MSNNYQNEIFNMIKQLTGSANLIALPIVFIEFCDDDISTALVLSQLIYWTDKSKNDGWVAKSLKDWEQELRLSRKMVDRIKNYLEKRQLIELKVKKFDGTPTMHYKVNQEKFAEEFLSFLKEKEKGQKMGKKSKFICEKGTSSGVQKEQVQACKRSVSLTEITTETTTKKDFRLTSLNGYTPLTHTSDTSGLKEIKTHTPPAHDCGLTPAQKKTALLAAVVEVFDDAFKSGYIPKQVPIVRSAKTHNMLALIADTLGHKKAVEFIAWCLKNWEKCKSDNNIGWMLKDKTPTLSLISATGFLEAVLPLYRQSENETESVVKVKLSGD